MRFTRLAARLLVVLALVGGRAGPAGAGTFTCVKKLDQPVGIITLVLSACTLSSSYATGGDVPADVGNTVCGSPARQKPAAVFVEGAKGGIAFSYDQVANKLQAFRLNIAASAIVAGANNTIVKNVAGTGLEVSGTGTTFQASLGEVTATTDLSAITIGMIALCP
jgi:hypothetical protein